jgi:hypothetical protein
VEQLGMVMLTQRPQDLLATSSKTYRHASQIDLILPALDKSFFYRAVDQFYRTVVLDKKPTREVLNAGNCSRWSSLYREHELVLLGFNPHPPRNAGAEVKKAANLEAKLCEVVVVRVRIHIWSA